MMGQQPNIPLNNQQQLIPRPQVNAPMIGQQHFNPFPNNMHAPSFYGNGPVYNNHQVPIQSGNSVRGRNLPLPPSSQIPYHRGDVPLVPNGDMAFNPRNIVHFQSKCMLSQSISGFLNSNYRLLYKFYTKASIS